MKISLSWLGDYVEWIETDPAKIAEKVTAHTAEVDEVEVQGALMDKCCVGQVKNLQKHPDADKLQTCTVVTDDGEKPIVCGGTNLRDGMRVAFAHVGASVRAPDGSLFTLTKAKIRGEVSEGMICAASELELEERFPDLPEAGNRPVIDLGDGDEGVGDDLRAYLELTDTVLHIDNHAITHRPDLFSHIGFARECVAIGIAKWKKDPTVEAPEFTSDDIPFGFDVKDSALMPRYCACMFAIDGLGETPDWMKRRLEATGWRSISLPIDITNYVMMEIGVPLHSFDADDIVGTVHFRQAQKGEKIVTLDKSERELTEGALILDDDEGIFDLLGIMGGLRSSTKDTTKHIYLHSASLDPASIRRAMIGMGHRTDAGTTYEKGVAAITTEQGFYRAAQLILELVPGAKIISKMDSFGDNGNPEPIAVDPEKVNAKLGTDLSVDNMKSIVEDLGFSAELKGKTLFVTPPLWRLKDCTGQHDIVEEIGRIYGFNTIEAVLPHAHIAPPARETRIHAMRDCLQECGYLELLPLNLLSPDLLQKAKFDPAHSPEIENPIGEENSLMQQSLLPRLLEHAGTYGKAGQQLRTFSVGNVFYDEQEHMELAALLSSPATKDMKQDAFLLAKQELSQAFGDAGYTLSITPAKTVPAFAHPGRCADISVEGVIVGTLSELHPEVRSNFSLDNRIAVVQLNCTALLQIPAQTTVARSVAQYPAVTYDETLDWSHAKSVANAITRAQAASSVLESLHVSDLYSPEQGQDYKLTLHFSYRSAERTLTEEEVKKEHEKVMASLGK